MTLKLVRVDDRLIHGQVMAIWLRALGAKTIVIVDDETANDDFLKEILELAAPTGVDVEVYGIEEGAPRVKELAESDEPTFVLVKSPVTALQIVERGAGIPVLNVGGMGAREGRRTFYKNISVDDAEIEAMRELEKRGTKVEFRIVYDEAATPFSSLDK